MGVGSDKVAIKEHSILLSNAPFKASFFNCRITLLAYILTSSAVGIQISAHFASIGIFMWLLRSKQSHKQRLESKRTIVQIGNRTRNETLYFGGEKDEKEQKKSNHD